VPISMNHDQRADGSPPYSTQLGEAEKSERDAFNSIIAVAQCGGGPMHHD
jgi:hypothetical protein